jgi:sugar (pentulose or hexulose) kinase
MLFCVRRGVELLAARPDRVRLTGGGARHPLVPQLQADLLQVPVDLVPDRSASAVGAARLAAAAVGAVLPPVPPPLRSVAPGSGSTATATAALAGAYRRWQDRVPLASR